MSKLQTTFDELRQNPIDLRGYKGELRDAAFEIVSADTFVAGITVTLLDGQRPEPSHFVVLEKQFLVETRWLLDDGRQIDLSQAPELYARARLIEQLRIECLRRVAD